MTGAKMGQEECQYQFRNSRWNCTTSKPSSDLQDIYGDVMRISKFLSFFLSYSSPSENLIDLRLRKIAKYNFFLFH